MKSKNRKIPHCQKTTGHKAIFVTTKLNVYRDGRILSLTEAAAGSVNDSISKGGHLRERGGEKCYWTVRKPGLGFKRQIYGCVKLPFGLTLT